MSWTGKEIAIIVTSTALGLVVVLVIGVNVAASFARRVLPSYAAVSETSQRLTDTDTQFPEVDCTPVEWRGDITRQKRYAEGLMSCLDEMWSPVVDKELDGGNLVTPHVDMRFYGDDAPILCGEGAEEYGVSFYCSRNRTIRTGRTTVSASSTSSELRPTNTAIIFRRRWGSIHSCRCCPDWKRTHGR
ncbi:hypothetical protein [Rhodococcus erythropolis]|uniref:hypothetical protein n=1 Tax=Rhodococcus erythropolis TaxID=1833 RepID=UPI001E4BBD6F|nr:hypothetical protein [Rhodococcus erythropolis]